jgi:hypothetical protein
MQHRLRTEECVVRMLEGAEHRQWGMMGGSAAYNNSVALKHRINSRVRTAGVPLRGPEDLDAPDLDSPGHALEPAEPPPERAPDRAPAGADGGAAAPAGGLPGAAGPPGAAGEPGAQGAGPEAAAEAPLEKEMEAEAMLAGLEQDPVPNPHLTLC